MSISQSVAKILDQHVTFELECIDRMYLNVYVPGLQFESGVAKFFRRHRVHQFASSALMDPMTRAFVASMEGFAKQQQIPVVQFRKGQRKDDVMQEQRAGALTAGAGFGPRLTPTAALMARQPNRHFNRRRDTSARLAG